MTPALLFENDALWALSKPAGVNVIPGRGPRPEPCLRDLWSQSAGRRVFVVHRLDRETSGVILFAKSPEAHRALSMAFEGRSIEKTYLAAVTGADVPATGVCRGALRAFGSGRVAVDDRGKPSETDFERLAVWDRGALLRVRPRTGRRHQIRVHLAHAGHPVYGDPLYGPPPRPVGGAPRLLLHAESLKIDLPAFGGPIAVADPAPADFRDALRIVGAGQISYLESTP